MKRLFLIITGLCTLIAPLIGGTARVDNLYQADISVAATSKEVRQQVLPQALLQVLIKVSGNSAIGSLPRIKQQLPKASHFVQQYQYYNAKQGTNEKNLMLRVKFEKSQVLQLLKANDQAIWSAARPLLLVWLISADKQILTAEDKSPIIDDLKNYFAKRGLEVVLPIGDLKDMQQISARDILEENLTKLQQEAKRYGLEQFIIGKVNVNETKHEQAWGGEWILYSQGQRMAWQESSDNLSQFVKSGVDNISNNLAAYYAVLPSKEVEKHSVLLTIKGIESIASYSWLSDYLRNMDSVAELQITSVAADEVEYQLNLNSSVSTFLQSLKSLQQLSEMYVDEKSKIQHFYYRYNS